MVGASSPCVVELAPSSSPIPAVIGLGAINVFTMNPGSVIAGRIGNNISKTEINGSRHIIRLNYSAGGDACNSAANLGSEC